MATPGCSRRRGGARRVFLPKVEISGLHKKNIAGIGCLAAAVYFAAAYWLQIAFDPGGSLDGEGKFLLKRPFKTFLDSKFAVIAIDPKWRLQADSADNNERSNIELYEDGKLLGPAHSVHRDVGTIGFRIGATIIRCSCFLRAIIRIPAPTDGITGP